MSWDTSVDIGWDALGAVVGDRWDGHGPVTGRVSCCLTRLIPHRGAKSPDATRILPTGMSSRVVDLCDRGLPA
ncbi:hypothetical protein [uncultured Thalassospira sp.]|uniref:hypothetical protein n=1 Tax=uncultured Thalassospira sp. TaxID=404382 RepID=UPI00258DBBC1|nr:hypothetical protein [uncultured Thalassospira sp.]